MEITSFFVVFVIFAIPGIIARRVYRLLTVPSSTRQAWEEVAEVILFSAGSYLMVAALGTIFDLFSVKFLFQPNPSLLTVESRSVWFSIILAAFAGYVLAHVQAKIRNERWVNRIAIKLNITKRFDDRSVWLQFLDLGEYDYIMVNDVKSGLLYYGEVRSYAESTNLREIWLRNVTVFNGSSGEKVYESDTIYIARTPEDLGIEIPSESMRVKK
jgi:hypothetical protein